MPLSVPQHNTNPKTAYHSNDHSGKVIMERGSAQTGQGKIKSAEGEAKPTLALNAVKAVLPGKRTP